MNHFNFAKFFYVSFLFYAIPTFSQSGNDELDSKTGKFSLDVQLYNNFLDDPFHSALSCRHTVSTRDGYIVYELVNYWFLLGLTQTRDRKFGSEVKYYPVLGYKDISEVRNKKPDSVDMSFEVLVAPIIIENPKKPGHALNTEDYTISLKMRKQFKEVWEGETLVVEKQVVEKFVEVKSPVGIGDVNVALVKTANGGEIQLPDPQATSYNTRNVMKGFVFSPTVEMEYFENDHAHKVACKICTPLYGNFYFNVCGELGWAKLQEEAEKIDLSKRGPLHMSNRDKKAKGCTNSGKVLGYTDPPKKEGN